MGSLGCGAGSGTLSAAGSLGCGSAAGSLGCSHKFEIGSAGCEVRVRLAQLEPVGCAGAGEAEAKSRVELSIGFSKEPIRTILTLFGRWVVLLVFLLVLLLLVVLLVREEGGKEFSPQHDMLLGDVTLHRRGGSAVDVLQKDGAGDSALQLVAVLR